MPPLATKARVRRASRNGFALFALSHSHCIVNVIVCCFAAFGELVAFDSVAGRIPHENGRVLSLAAAAAASSAAQAPPPSERHDRGLYVCGWLKRGPSGIVGTNKFDAEETVASLLADNVAVAATASAAAADSGAPSAHTRRAECRAALLRVLSPRVVSFGDWQRVDAAERRRGEAVGKCREKFVGTAAVRHFLRISPAQ